MNVTLNTGTKSFISRKRNEVAKEAPKRKHCPKCSRARAIKFYGLRTHKPSTPGGKFRVSLQSYCVDCRNK